MNDSIETSEREAREPDLTAGVSNMVGGDKATPTPASVDKQAALVAKLRYMGKQYAAGQVARGGAPQKHYLEEAADEIEMMAWSLSVNKVTPESAQENAALRNVIQAACIDGLPGLARAWEKYFPDRPITIKGAEVERLAAQAAPTAEALQALVYASKVYRAHGIPTDGIEATIARLQNQQPEPEYNPLCIDGVEHDPLCLKVYRSPLKKCDCGAQSAALQQAAVPPQEFESAQGRALASAWAEGWAQCRDAEYVGEEAESEAFNQSHTLAQCLYADQTRFQGGLSNDQLRRAWSAKLPNVIPTDEQLTAFALGIEAAAQPLKAEQAKDAAEDAEMLDWLTRKVSGKAMREAGVVWPAWSPEYARTAIRSAMAQERKA